MSDTLDDIGALARQFGATASRAISNAATTAQQLMSGIGRTAREGWSQAKQTPANVGTVKQGLQQIGLDAPRSGFSRYPIESRIRQAKDEAVGFWRGYVAPRFR